MTDNEEVEPYEDGPVEAPIYAWRIYRVVRSGGSKIVVPLYWPTRSRVDGQPGLPKAGVDPDLNQHIEWAQVDLLDWVVADKVPKIYAHGTVEDTHGIHAFHGIGQAILYGDQYLVQYTDFEHNPKREIILAKVELQGVVVEHAMGYRAEKVRIVELRTGGTDEERSQLADDLGWPFTIEHHDLVKSGPQPMKGSPIVRITADVSKMTIALTEARDQVEAYRPSRFLEAMQNDISSGMPFDGAFRRACLRSTNLAIDIHHIFLIQFARRSAINVNWGLYDPNLLHNISLDDYRNWASRLVETHACSAMDNYHLLLADKFHNMPDYQLLTHYEQFLHSKHVHCFIAKTNADQLDQHHHVSDNGYRMPRDLWDLSDPIPLNQYVQQIEPPKILPRDYMKLDDYETFTDTWRRELVARWNLDRFLQKPPPFGNIPGI